MSRTDVLSLFVLTMGASILVGEVASASRLNQQGVDSTEPIPQTAIESTLPSTQPLTNVSPHLSLVHRDQAERVAQASTTLNLQQDDQPLHQPTDGMAQMLSVSQLSEERSIDHLGRVPSVADLSDVQPNDWARQSLQLLIERYGCIAGFPDGRYLGNRILTRFEFAAGLNACLQQIEETQAIATQEDIAILQRLQAEFAAELSVLRGQVEALEARFSDVGTTGFSTTTKLQGTTIFAVSDIFGNTETNRDNNLVLQGRVDLNLDTSFTGEDRLRTALSFGNFDRFTLPDDAIEGRLSFAANTDNTLALDSLSYEFPAGDATLAVIPFGGSLSDFATSINPLGSSNRGAVSRFGQRNPIYRAAGLDTGSGFGASLELVDELTLNVGYLAGNSDRPEAGNGLFNGGYAMIGQIAFTPEPFSVAFAYAHSYVPEGGNRTGTGSEGAIVAVPYVEDAEDENTRPVVVNSYVLELNYQLSEQVEIGGWVGFSAIRAIELGDASVWNYAVRLALSDLGGEGNLAGLIVGMQPRLTGTTPGLGLALGQRSDPAVGMHIEGFYRVRLNDSISITPGFVWLTAPNHNPDNSDVVITTVRTTFSF